MKHDYLKASPLLPGVLVSKNGEMVLDAETLIELRISVQKATGARTFRYKRGTYTVARTVATAFMGVPDYEPFFVLHRDLSKGDRLDNLFFSPKNRVTLPATWRKERKEETTPPRPFLELELRATRSLPHLEVCESGAFLIDRATTRCYFPVVHSDGRRTVTVDGRPYSMLTLVGEAFLGCPPVGMQNPFVMYREGKDSCHYRNLEYMEKFSSAYMERCKAVGVTAKDFVGRMIYPCTKLDYDTIKEIKLEQAYGVSASDLAKRYGVSNKLILNVFKKSMYDIFGQ